MERQLALEEPLARALEAVREAMRGVLDLHRQGVTFEAQEFNHILGLFSSISSQLAEAHKVFLRMMTQPPPEEMARMREKAEVIAKDQG